jgi:hypothetical protein
VQPSVIVWLGTHGERRQLPPIPPGCQAAPNYRRFPDSGSVPSASICSICGCSSSLFAAPNPPSPWTMRRVPPPGLRCPRERVSQRFRKKWKRRPAACLPRPHYYSGTKFPRPPAATSPCRRRSHESQPPATPLCPQALCAAPPSAILPCAALQETATTREPVCLTLPTDPPLVSWWLPLPPGAARPIPANSSK